MTCALVGTLALPAATSATPWPGSSTSSTAATTEERISVTGRVVADVAAVSTPALPAPQVPLGLGFAPDPPSSAAGIVGVTAGTTGTVAGTPPGPQRVSAPSPLRLTTVAVREGDHVRSGQELARFDDAAFRAAEVVAARGIDTASAQVGVLDQAIADTRSTESDLRGKRREVVSASATLHAKRTELLAARTEAQAALREVEAALPTAQRGLRTLDAALDHAEVARRRIASRRAALDNQITALTAVRRRLVAAREALSSTSPRRPDGDPTPAPPSPESPTTITPSPSAPPPAVPPSAPSTPEPSTTGASPHEPPASDPSSPAPPPVMPSWSVVPAAAPRTTPPGSPDRARERLADLDRRIARVDAQLRAARHGRASLVEAEREVVAKRRQATTARTTLRARQERAREGRARLVAGLARMSAGLARIDTGIDTAQDGLRRIDEGLTRVQDARRRLGHARHQAHIAVETARTNRAQAAVTRARTVVVAPVSGRITRVAQVGDVLAPGATVATLVTDTDRARPTVLAWVPPQEVSRTCLGATAQVTADWLPVPIPGRLTRVGPRAEYPPTSQATDEIHLLLAVPVEVRLDPLGADTPLPQGTPVGLVLDTCASTTATSPTPVTSSTGR